MKKTIVKLPINTCYLKEFIYEFLKIYNTVSIQMDEIEEIYIIQVEEFDNNINATDINHGTIDTQTSEHIAAGATTGNYLLY